MRMYAALMEMDPPEGYERVSWDGVVAGEEVWVIAFDETATELRVKAVGPFEVHNAFRRALVRPGGGREFTEAGERLLRKAVAS